MPRQNQIQDSVAAATIPIKVTSPDKEFSLRNHPVIILIGYELELPRSIQPFCIVKTFIAVDIKYIPCGVGKLSMYSYL